MRNVEILKGKAAIFWVDELFVDNWIFLQGVVGINNAIDAFAIASTRSYSTWNQINEQYAYFVII
jgi:hypothetical protein